MPEEISDVVIEGVHDNQCGTCSHRYLDAVAVVLDGVRVFVSPTYTSTDNCRKIVSAWNDNKRIVEGVGDTFMNGKWAHPRLCEGPKGDGAPDFDGVDFLECYVVCGVFKPIGSLHEGSKSYVGMVYDPDVKDCYICRMPFDGFSSMDAFILWFMESLNGVDPDEAMRLEITNFFGLVSY